MMYEYTSTEVEMSCPTHESTEYVFILYSDANSKKIHKKIRLVLKKIVFLNKKFIIFGKKQ